MEIRTNESGFDVEIRVCEKLLKKGIPACKFIPNKQGKMLSSDEKGRRFTVSDFYDGITYAYNEAPYNMQKESAALLAKIHEGYGEYSGWYRGGLFCIQKTGAS